MTPPPEPVGRLQRAGVVGGGTMGAGIAQVLLAAGVTVTLVEADADAAARARARLEDALAAAAARGKLAGPPASLLRRLDVTDDPGRLRDAELVIEAVPESPELKRQVLGGIEAAVAPWAVIASNTSSLSIDRLAAALDRPERFCGMHFFNPVPASQLVEVVRGAHTGPGALGRAHAVAALLGKESIEVADSPGFATSRLGVLLGLEAIRMVAEGVAAPEDIDKAMVLGYRHPMGPLRLTDLVGLDVRLAIAEHLQARLGERFAPPELLRTMVADGRLGKKAGRGFYRWP